MSLIFTESCKCDFCNKELIVDTRYPARYALKLSAIDVNRNSTSEQYCIHIFPPLDRDKHFCGSNCLAGWLVK